jgi:hypothetical protein
MVKRFCFKRLFAITKSYFKLGWKNLPFYMIPVAWLVSPFCILIGWLFLEDFLMGVKESDY